MLSVAGGQARRRYRRAHRGSRSERGSRYGTRSQINAALLEHKVIFFRDQHRPRRRRATGLRARLGTPTTAHPTVTSRGNRVLPIDSRYDKANAGTPTSHSSTASRKHRCCARFRCPTYGGTTTWASTEAAYEQLPAPLRALAENLWAVHTNDLRLRRRFRRRRRQLADTVREYRAGVRLRLLRDRAPGRAGAPGDRTARAAARPLRQALRRAGPAESATLFGLLQDRITKLENTIRWSWAAGRPGDLGQPRHPALRRLGLRRPVPAAQPGHPGR